MYIHTHKMKSEMREKSQFLRWQSEMMAAPGLASGEACLPGLQRASLSLTSLVAQMVKRLPGMQETWVRFLGQEDPLEKEMAIHSSTLAWKIPWTEEPDRLQSMGSQRVRHNWATSLHFTHAHKVRTHFCINLFNLLIIGSYCVYWEEFMLSCSVVSESLLPFGL